jgi:hypothetical protein
MVKQGDARPVTEVAAALSPERGALGFALAGVELLHQHFIGMQPTSLL